MPQTGKKHTNGRKNNLKPQSAKAKGRRLQQWTRDTVLKFNPELGEDDVRSTSMGAGGEDIQLSTAARKLVPFQIECKNKREVAVSNWYDQAKEHGNHIPLLIVKQDHGSPLAVVDAEVFFDMIRKLNGSI